MAAQLDWPKESIIAKPLTGKRNLKKSVKESYVIYSIYFVNEPDKGHVVYSKDKGGWEFFGYIPTERLHQLSQHTIPHIELGL
jgi:hypothetical protein